MQERSHVIVLTTGIYVDIGHFLIAELSPDLRRHSENQAVRWDDCVFGDEGAGADDRSFANRYIVKYRGAHADQTMRLDDTPVATSSAVTDTDVIAEGSADIRPS